MSENIWTHMTPTAKRHMAAICSDAIAKTNIIGLRKAFNAFERSRAGYSVSRTAPNITADEYSALERAVEEKQPRVVGELHDSGIKLLQNPRNARRLAPVADIIADLACFRLIGFGWLDATHCVPQYRAIARDGRKFAFQNVPWQSGGNGPEILL